MKITKRSWAEPYKIKMIEPLIMTSGKDREKAIKDAGYNTFLLKSKDVYIDLLTDSGTNAMSDYQWAGMMLGDEAYAGSKNYYYLEDNIKKYYGFKYLIPTHQGRGAEHLVSQILIKKGDYIPGNMYFTTTRLHQELAGGTFVDVICDEAHNPDDKSPFKGNIDLNKLENLIKEVGPKKIPYVSVAGPVNMAGGQPISMKNIRDVKALCDSYGVKIWLDATRAVENCYFIKMREKGYEKKTIAEILKEMCSHFEGIWVSAKKDLLVNIGGFLATRNKKVFEEGRNLVVVYEGLHTYGGLAGRDLEAMARGIEEMVNFDYLHSRIGQIEYFGNLLLKAKIPIVTPIGGHAVFLNARKFLPHVPQDQFPAQTLCSEIYLDSGVRSMERGIVSAGRDTKTGDHKYPKLELVRLTFPRRVYTQAHLDVTFESIAEVYNKRKAIKGLKMIYEPKYLRFFQARFVPIK
jgi:tyrosine phenol-lyase